MLLSMENIPSHNILIGVRFFFLFDIIKNADIFKNPINF